MDYFKQEKESKKLLFGGAFYSKQCKRSLVGKQLAAKMTNFFRKQQVFVKFFLNSFLPSSF